MSLAFLISLFLGFAFFIWRLWSSDKPQKFTKRKHWALMLALPMADAINWRESFLNAKVDHLLERDRNYFRASLLHQLEYRANASDDDVRLHLAEVLETQWFRADLYALRPTDDPRAALAFACARMAFFVRVAMLMQWTDDQAAWRVLLLNARRAEECFKSWEDYGRAYIAGRKQWVEALRADPMGKTYGEDYLQELLNKSTGAWARLPWPGLPIRLG